MVPVSITNSLETARAQGAVWNTDTFVERFVEHLKGTIQRSYASKMIILFYLPMPSNFAQRKELELAISSALAIDFCVHNRVMFVFSGTGTPKMVRGDRSSPATPPRRLNLSLHTIYSNTLDSGAGLFFYPGLGLIWWMGDNCAKKPVKW